MEAQGRENKLDNDLFFVCAVIEHIGRATKNKRGEVIKQLGEKEIARLLELADVLHCQPIEATFDDLAKRASLSYGSYDNVALCKYAIPTHFDIAKVYKRLISDISNKKGIPPTDALVAVYTSWISEKIDDYNSSMYYESPQYLYASYEAGRAIED